MNASYIFDDTDREVVKIAMHLLAKIWHSDLLSEKEKELVAAMGSLLKEMPEGVHDYFNASVTLTGPRRKFGNHEIYHYWTVESQDGEVKFDASGHFYRPSTGGDAFTSFTWIANPGSTTICRDFSERIAIVDDAQPIGAEVAGIDLNEAGYQVRLEVDGESFGSEEDEDADEDEDEDEELDAEEDDPTLVELAVCLWAFMDSDTELIYALAGRVYAIEGNEEEVLQSLKALSRHDFRTVERVKVPARFKVTRFDGTTQVGLASPTLLNDPGAMLFNELYDQLEQSLPPLPDFVSGKPIKQKLGEDPLSCRTLVYEDATGVCRAIVDPADVEWLRSRTSAH